MSEQLNVEKTCHFCDTPLEGVMLTLEAIGHLAAQAAVRKSDALKDEMKQMPTIGHVCAHCGTGFCIEHFRQLGPHGLRGFLQGLGKTPCPQCDQPLKDYLIIMATPSAEFRAFIDQEIDEVLNPKSFGEFLKDSVGEIRDAITEPVEETDLWRRWTYGKADGSEIEPPGRAPLLDFWPGRCTSCGEETNQPITYVVYSCRYESRKVKGGLGVAIISTSMGVVSDRIARKEGVGGELLCTIW